MQGAFTASKSESGTSVCRSRGLRLVDVPDSDFGGLFEGIFCDLDLSTSDLRSQSSKSKHNGLIGAVSS
ncbi:MAG: hypothetical protein K2H92_08340 [Bacteroidaceae bacterium]|nr:hypothetical protein [Bacteroidaceae bacterium]